jgi:hypothetical protein
MTPTKTWAQTTLDSEAMEDIKGIIGHYLPPDNGITAHDALSAIIRAVETRTGHRFITLAEAK